MNDFPLRAVTDAEFEPWARMIADTYGLDHTADELAAKRDATDLSRTIAAFDGAAPVGGASIYPRSLTVPGAHVPVAGVASAGVAPTHRRRGVLTAMMRRQLTDLHEQQLEPVAALRASEAGIYGRYGFGPASRGDRARIDRRAVVFRGDVDFGAGSVELAVQGTAAQQPVLEEVYDRVRAVSPGWPDRDRRHWTVRLARRPAGAGALRCAVHREPGGAATGYALYRHLAPVEVHGAEAGVVGVAELAALSRTAHAALWRFLAGIDLVRWIDAELAVDDPLHHLLVEPRAIGSSPVDRLWVRPVEVDRALAARRYSVPVDVVFEVVDEFCPWNTGRFRLQADEDEAGCERTAAPADLRLGSAELGAAYLGGTTLAALAGAGLVEQLRPGALARASTAFRGLREPFYPGGWAFPLY